MKIIALCASLIILISRYAAGDSFAPPSSYKVVSSNQKYVFVMIAPLTKDEDANHWVEKKKNEILEIRNKYPKSGMYLNNETNQLLWSVDWYWYGVEISNDGESVITNGGMASDLNDKVLTFYNNGNVVQSYRVNQLVKNKRKLQHTVSHFFWESERLFDREQNKYYVETMDNRHFIFDVKNGNIISGPK